MASDDLNAMLDELRKKGYNDAQISQALRQQSMPQTAAPTAPAHHVDAITTIVAIGLLLVVMAVIIIITSQWGMLGPIGKTLLILVPVAVLYLISALTSLSTEQENISMSTFILGTFLVPLLIGTIVYQFGWYATLDTNLIGWCAVVGWLLFYLMEIVWRKTDVAPITLLYLFVAFSAWLVHFEPKGDLIFWIYFVLGLGLIVDALIVSRTRPESASARLAVGAVLSVFAMPMAIQGSFDTSYDRYIDIFSGIMLFNGLLYWLISLAVPKSESTSAWPAMVAQVKMGLAEVGWLIILFAPFGWQYDRIYIIPLLVLYSFGITILSIKLPIRILMPAGSLALFITVMQLASYSEYYSTTTTIAEYFFPVLAIVAGLGLILSSIKIKIETFLPIGALAVVAGVLNISQRLFINTLGWPITVFVLGILFIALGYLLNRIGRLRDAQITTYQPMVGWHIDHHETVKDGTQPQGVSKPRAGCLALVGKIILAIILLQVAIQFLYTIMSSVNTQPSSSGEIVIQQI